MVIDPGAVIDLFYRGSQLGSQVTVVKGVGPGERELLVSYGALPLHRKNRYKLAQAMEIAFWGG